MPHGYMLLVSSQRVVCMVVWWGTTTMSSININDVEITAPHCLIKHPSWHFGDWASLFRVTAPHVAEE